MKAPYKTAQKPPCPETASAAPAAFVMLLLDFTPRPPSVPVLVRGPVQLRVAGLGDFPAWAALRRNSRAHLTAWEPAWRDNELTRESYRFRVRLQWRDIRSGAALPMLVFARDSGALVGGVSLSNIRYGAAQAGTVGYWTGAPYVRRGYARAAVQAMLDHAFASLALNRVEAACQPGNVASVGLLESVGFRQEGLAREYLRINGAWRDHYLYAVTAAEFAARQES